MTILPLLGWFYLSLALYGVWRVFISILSKKILLSLDRLILHAILIAVAVWTVGYGVQGVVSELRDTKRTARFFFEPFEQKITQEHGYYMLYSQLLGHLADVKRLKLVDVATQEFHMARMYLYPIAVEQAGLISVRAGDYVFASSELVKDFEWQEIAKIGARSLAIATTEGR